MKKIIILSIISTLLFSCFKEDEDVLQIITTTSFVNDTISRIAGDKIEITNLITYGQDPHAYDPTPRDIARVEKADIIFVNGFDLEEGLLEILKNVNREKIVELSQNIKPIELENFEENHHDGIDPHTWMSPLNVIEWVKTATTLLIEISPENRNYFQENRDSYIKELLILHEEIEKKLSLIENDERIMVTDHDSFAYFAREYQFTIAGTIIPNVSSNSDTTARSLIELIKIIEQNELMAIFVGDSSGNDMVQLAMSIQSELDFPVKIVILKTGSLDEKGNAVDSYLKYMRFNVDLIVSGLSK